MRWRNWQRTTRLFSSRNWPKRSCRKDGWREVFLRRGVNLDRIQWGVRFLKIGCGGMDIHPVTGLEIWKFLNERNLNLHNKFGTRENRSKRNASLHSMFHRYSNRCRCGKSLGWEKLERRG